MKARANEPRVAYPRFWTVAVRAATIGEWSLSAVFFGILFQVSIKATGLNPEKIGFILSMHPALVTGLFAMSFLFLLGYWWLKRTQVNGGS